MVVLPKFLKLLPQRLIGCLVTFLGLEHPFVTNSTSNAVANQLPGCSAQNRILKLLKCVHVTFQSVTESRHPQLDLDSQRHLDLTGAFLGKQCGGHYGKTVSLENCRV